jgi:hypothetical protein
MLLAHMDMVLRMRPLGPPDADCTDSNRHGWDRPPDEELPWSETNHYGYTDTEEGSET